jgi:hypothetical protein
MELFGLLLDQFVRLRSFAHGYMLSIFQFDADWFIDFSTRSLINRFNGLEFRNILVQVVFNLRESNIKIYVGVDGDIRWFLISELRFWNPGEAVTTKVYKKSWQNGNGSPFCKTELFHDGDALLQSIRPL